MKIAYVYDAVYPWETGGVQKRVWELARRLADKHDVHWYGLHYWDGPKVMDRDGVTLHGVDHTQELYVDDRRSITEALSFSLNLIPALRKTEFDLIDCQVFPYFSCYATELTTLLDSTGLVFTWHEVWQEYWAEYLGRKGIFGRLVERGTAALPGEHVAVSRRTKRDLASLGRPECQILPNGIDIKEITTTPLADEPVDVLFVGRFIPEKNPGLLVRAIDHLRKSVPKVRCKLVGDGPVRSDVESFVSDRGLEDNVQLLDFRDSHEDIIALMKAADVFVLPSHREGFGITVLEALASGTPVVTTDHPNNAATELVRPGKTGYVVPTDDVALAEAIQKARSGIESQDCKDAAAEYDWDEIAIQAATLYQNVRK